MRHITRALFLLLAVLLLFSSSPIASERVDARLIHDGRNLGLVLTAAPGWHVSVKQDGTPGMDPNITIISPNTIQVRQINLPKGKAFSASGLTFYGYEGTVTIPISISQLPQSGTLVASVRWLVCGDVCVPESETVTMTLSAAPTDIDPMSQIPPPSPTIGALGLALISALIGGFILNLMPCVFPVLSIKIFGLAQQSTQNSMAVKRHGIAFSLGMMITIWGLAAVLIGVQSTAAALGWGFQLQSPYVVTGLIVLFTLIGLNLFGVFEAGLFLTRAGDGFNHKGQTKGLLGSVLNGALVTIVATPCTAPFMGSALGYTLTQPAWVTVAVLTALGTGLALPFLVLSWVPKLSKYLPKPGPWMETLRQFLAFPMIASAIWLVTVLHAQVGPHAATIVWALVGISWIMWGYGKLLGNLSPWRWAVLALAMCLIGWTIFYAKPRQSDGPTWHPYSVAAVHLAQQQGRPVFIDFTAEWCLTCQVNKRTTLTNAKAIAMFKKKNVALFRADWTNQDPSITRALHQLGRNGVPVYAWIPSNQSRPILLPEILTPDLVIKALNSD